MISREKLEAKDRLLGDFFQSRGASRFRVPEYQRRFVWKTKQLIDFIDSIYQSDNGYFIGTFVLVGPDHDTYEMEILDGQQRISCLFLLLKAAYDYFSNLDTSSREIDELLRYIESVLYKGEKSPNSVRLVFNDKYTQNFFGYIINESDPTNDPNMKAWIKDIEQKTKNSPRFEKAAEKKSVTRLFSNYEDILAYISQLSQTELKTLCEKVFNLQIIELICKDARIVNTLFEGLNSKGIKLTNSELIKNKLYQRVREVSAPDTVKENWESLDLNFFANSRDGLIDKYLRHYYIARSGYIQGSELYDRYLDEIKSKDKDLEDYTRKLMRYGEYYTAISDQRLSPETNPTKIHTSSYQEFNNFGILDNDQIYEVLLALFINVNESPLNTLQTKELNIILKKLWAFCFRARFLPISPSKYERKFAIYCSELHKWSTSRENLFTKSINFINENLVPLVADEEQLIKTINADLDYKSRNVRLLTKVFTDLLSTERPVIYMQATIEHIVPQSPESKWKLQRSDTQDFVHKLGNLTLLDRNDNITSENETFLVKLEKCYLKDTFAFNKSLESLKDEFASGSIQVLTDTILKRGEEIAKKLANIYSLV